MNLLPNIARCLVLDGVNADAIERLQTKGVEVLVGPTGPSAEKLIELVEDFTPTAVIVRSATKVNAAVLDSIAFCVRIVARAGVGVDNIDVDRATKHGILVLNAPQGNTLSAAEHTCALILSMSRQLPLSRVTELGCWRAAKKAISQAPILEVSGKTLGIIGLGKIGSAVGSRMHAFDMRVIGYDPIWDNSKPLPYWLSRNCSLEEIFAEADYITLHVPFLPSTTNLISKITLRKCKPGVRIINCSRAGVVDIKALLEGLNSGHCGFVALDVLDEEPPSLEDEIVHKLMQRTDVIITPHLGASSNEAQGRVAVEVANSCLAIGGLSETSLTGLENGLNMNELGVALRRVLQKSSKDIQNYFKLLCDLVVVGGLSTSMDPEVALLSSFKAILHFTCRGEDEAVVLVGVFKFLLADLLFKRQDVFPDVLRALVITTPTDDTNSLTMKPLNDGQHVELELTCEGKGNVVVSRRFELVPREKGHSVHLVEKDGQKLSTPVDLGGLPFGSKKPFKPLG